MRWFCGAHTIAKLLVRCVEFIWTFGKELQGSRHLEYSSHLNSNAAMKRHNNGAGLASYAQQQARAPNLRRYRWELDMAVRYEPAYDCNSCTTQTILVLKVPTSSITSSRWVPSATHPLHEHS